MANIRPFAALRPRPDLAERICELPYDVMSTEEARALAEGNPLSFLHVSKPEIDLPAGTDPYDARVYATGRSNLSGLIHDRSLLQDNRPHFYLYRQIMGAHRQLGLVAVASCEDYLQNRIKKHELTRVDKEEDRVRHIDTLNAQTGPVFLAYRARPALDALFERETARDPEVDFVAPDQIRHSAWTVSAEGAAIIQQEFARIPGLYIADGHHRSAAAARVCQAREGAGESAFFLAVIFPDQQLQILPYNRVLKDLNGFAPDELLSRLEAVFVIRKDGAAVPTRPHELGLYLQGTWYSLFFRPQFAATQDPIERLDVTLLQKYVLAPLFAIENPRTSARIQFVGGIRGTAELEKMVSSGGHACAFSMFPTRMADLMAVADADGLMPPKSTWFEPKLRDGMFSHLLG